MSPDLSIVSWIILYLNQLAIQKYICQHDAIKVMIISAQILLPTIVRFKISCISASSSNLSAEECALGAASGLAFAWDAQTVRKPAGGDEPVIPGLQYFFL